MSDPTDNGQRNPLSSSSSHASGTSARNITTQPDHNPDAPQAAQDHAVPSDQDSGAAAAQDQYQNQDHDAGSPSQADRAEPEAAGYHQSAPPPVDQRHAGTEHEASGNFAPSYEPPAGNYADYTPLAAERQFDDAAEQTPQYSQPAEEDHAAAADEGDTGYAQPAAESDLPPAGEQDAAQPAPVSSVGYDADYTQRSAEMIADAEIDQPLTAEASDAPSPPIDEPAYMSEAVADLDSVAPRAIDGDDAPSSRPLPNGFYPEAANELRAAALETIAETKARQEKTLALFDQVSRRFTAVLEEAGVDAARVTFKVMEFAQAGLKNNLELAKSYAAARSVTDIFGLHTAYMTRQFELLNAQAEELREMTSKFALRNAASLKPQFERDQGRR